MKDGAAWVIYTLEDGSSAIVAWPRAEEGWDEALPEPVGTADTDLGAYRIKNMTAAMIYFGHPTGPAHSVIAGCHTASGRHVNGQRA